MVTGEGEREKRAEEGGKEEGRVGVDSASHR